MKPRKISDCMNDFLYAGYEKEIFAHVNTHIIRSHQGNVETLSTPTTIGMIAAEGINFDEYIRLINDGCYSFILSDYSLVSIECTFMNDDMIRHRYIYIPCPIIPSVTKHRPVELEIGDFFQQLDLADMKKSFVSNGYLRFDYTRDNPPADMYHPLSHLTLISPDCRIGVRSPISVATFLRFIFDNFHTEAKLLWKKFESQIAVSYEDSIHEHERMRMHLHWSTPR